MRTKLLISVGAVAVLSTVSILALCRTPVKAQPEYTRFSVEVTPTPIPYDRTAETELPQPTEIKLVYLDESEDAPDNDLSDEERYLLAKLAMSEAGNQDIDGKALVMRVVLNRVSSTEFPDTVKNVIFQKNQFSPVSDGRYFEIEPNDECYEALDMIVNDGWDESAGALYFESESASTWHAEHLKLLFQHQDHIFYADKEG